MIRHFYGENISLLENEQYGFVWIFVKVIIKNYVIFVN